MNKKTAMAEQTKQKLKDAFLELYAGRGMGDVTVGAVTKRAGYNRCTFYNYYDDLRGILDEIEDGIVEKIQAKMIGSFAEGVHGDITEIFSLTLSFFEENGDTLYLLLGKNGDETFRQRIHYMLKKHFRELFKDRVDTSRLEYILAFAVSAGLGMIEHWAETEREYSAEEFLRLAQELIANGVLGQLRKER